MMYIVRHSERLDEQVSEDDYDNYISSKLKEGELNQLRRQRGEPVVNVTASNPDPSLPAIYQRLYPTYCRRRNKHIYCDPPITTRGIGIAEEAGHALSHLISNRMIEMTGEQKFPSIHLYSSRLQRCVQTAYAIAKQLKVNSIYISSGLALTAAAVDKCMRKDNNFDYLNMEEICAICYDMVVYDCDHGIVYNNILHDITILSKEGDNNNQLQGGQEIGESDLSAVDDKILQDGQRHHYRVCTSDWYNAIHHISEHVHNVNTVTSDYLNDTQNSTNHIICKVIVAHRETIRNLMVPYVRLRLPYCCISELLVSTEQQYNDDTRQQEEVKKLRLGKLYTPKGELMTDLTPEHMRNSTAKL